MKFAATPPGGPVFVSIPDDILGQPASADIIDQSGYDVPVKIRADAADIEKVARMLIEAKNPLLSVGDEITMCHGEAEVLQLAELPRFTRSRRRRIRRVVLSRFRRCTRSISAPSSRT